MTKKIALLYLLLLVFFSCSGTKSTTHLKIAGGTAHIKAQSEIASVLMANDPSLKISISGGGSGVGIKQVGEGLIDIGNSGREIKESEIETFGLVAYKMALDGIAVVVNKDMKLSALTTAQLSAIYNGTIQNWNEVGGPDAKINLYTRGAESGTRKTFVKLGLNKGEVSKKAIVTSSNGNMKIAVSKDPFAIGYISVGYVDSSVKALKVDGVYPDSKAIQEGSYPVCRYLLMVTKGEAEAAAKSFIEYVQSAPGQNIIAKYGLIKLK